MFPSPKFFPGARMNFTGSILLNRDPKAPAIYEAQEGNLDSKLFTQEMIYSHVEKIADAMRECGVGKGDRVAAVIANTELSISLCLAALSIGAIWSSISPDFGVQGILDRLVQIDAKLVFANTTVVYNGKMRNLVPTIESWAKTICQGASLENIVLTENVNTAEITKGVTLDKFLSQGSGKKLEFEQLLFCQPAFIFYSSGTVRKQFNQHITLHHY
jgi:acetoacetyl-CoA synthetase